MEKNYNEIVYYYLREEKNADGSKGKPYGVVAVKENFNGTVNRGVSLCSKEDTFNKKAGRGIALKRLMKAEKEKKTTEFPKYYGTNAGNIYNIPFNTKCGYHSEMTISEYRMFNKPNGVK